MAMMKAHQKHEKMKTSRLVPLRLTSAQSSLRAARRSAETTKDEMKS